MINLHRGMGVSYFVRVLGCLLLITNKHITMCNMASRSMSVLYGLMLYGTWILTFMLFTFIEQILAHPLWPCGVTDTKSRLVINRSL